MTPHWLRLLVIDLGFIDSDAFSGLAFHRYDPVIYIEFSFKRAGTDVTSTCLMAKQLWGKMHPIKTIVDTGGLGLKIANELTSRHGISFEAAMKSEKDANDRLLNADLKTGRVKLVVPHCGPLIEELRTLERDLKTGKERKGQENHCIDTARYGVRAAKHYRAEHWSEPPAAGSVEWELEQMRLERERDLAAARERYEAQQSGRLVDVVRSLQ